MKKFLVLAVLMSSSVMAGERVLLNDSKEASVEVNAGTLFCSGIGYGINAQLKINIPALDGWTVLDHTNIASGDFRNLPCLTAGYCKDFRNQEGLEIEDVLQGNPRTEKIVIFRKLIEKRELAKNECEKTLIETLETKVGGVRFTHKRSIEAETLPSEACTF